MAPLPFEAIAAHLKDRYAAAVLEVDAGNKIPFVRVQPGAVADLARYLKGNAEFAFDFLVYIAGVDYPAEEKITLVYHFFSYKHRHAFMMKADVPRAGGRAASLTSVYAAADWLEREVYDLFGVTFEGHPNLTRILTPEGFVGHPLLKDFTSDDYVPFPEYKL